MGRSLLTQLSKSRSSIVGLYHHVFSALLEKFEISASDPTVTSLINLIFKWGDAHYIEHLSRPKSFFATAKVYSNELKITSRVISQLSKAKQISAEATSTVLTAIEKELKLYNSFITNSKRPKLNKEKDMYRSVQLIQKYSDELKAIYAHLDELLTTTYCLSIPEDLINVGQRYKKACSISKKNK